MFNRLAALIAAVGALAAGGASLAATPASAATVQQATSQNWAGYVASTSSSTFSRVSGSWVQPSATASAGDGYSAFWVGLGGAGQSQSQSLEQVGTQADVVGGQTVYYAWYELLPSAPVKLSLAIHPGDHIAASVSVSGSSVTVSLSDETTSSSYSKTLQMSSPDTSSAEWVAEAPSTADRVGNFQPLPLADFGKVNFTSAAATAAGHTGTISDPSWAVQAVQLGGSSTTVAQPSALSSDGSSFSVSRQSANANGGVGATTSGSGSQRGYGGYGGYGYGGYGYGGYGYGGYGYGGYGYGYGGYGPAGYSYGY
jgi:hypothetical protein